MAVSDITIWHNPRCSKSRDTLKLLLDNDLTPTERRYLDDAPSLDELKAAARALGLPPRVFCRTNETLYKELGLATADDATLLQAMAQNPRLIERPIVFAHGAAAIGRPPQAVLRLFQRPT